jgi:hypothetical protein
MTPGIPPSALRARLRRFIITPGDFVSLHAGVAARADQRQKLERLCRYVSRPATAEKRLLLTPNDKVRYDVKGITSVAGAGMRRSDPAEDALPRRHDTRHLSPDLLPSALRASLRLFKIAPGDLVEPLDFIARLAALLPKPRAKLTRLCRSPHRLASTRCLHTTLETANSCVRLPMKVRLAAFCLYPRSRCF